MSIRVARRDARVALLLCAVAAGLLLGAQSCSSQRQAGFAVQQQAQLPPVLAGLPEPGRLASAAGDFAAQHDGAEFAADLAFSRCEAAGTAVRLTPQYAPPDLALADAAYCLYRLELDPGAADAQLSLVWNGIRPDKSSCWLGLSDWERGTWDWCELSSNTLAITEPGRYADALKHCFAALVVLGTTQVALASIGFGEPPAPSTGYILYQPLTSETTYLIDDQGTVVHTWPGEHASGASTLLDEQGRLWRQVTIFNRDFQFGGRGGRLEVLDWDGSLLWEHELSNSKQCTHHDFKLMPNGNVLLTVWNKYTTDEAVAIGRDPALVGINGLYIDSIVELETLCDEPQIVWQWDTADHLIQDVDDTKPNYGDPTAHPELVDINFVTGQGMDWTHTNGIAYNPDLDQLVLSVHGLSELWVIDRSTTTEEAAGHSGGRYGRGGDLLYRWGNPVGYGGGTEDDRTLFGQHDVHWIAPGLPGAGDLLIYNNLAGSPEGLLYSTVLQITPPLAEDGSYIMNQGRYGPDSPTWLYKADPPEDMYSPSISSTQRLENGNTLICDGAAGRFLEVQMDGTIVWQYVNPYPSDKAMVFRAIFYRADYPGLKDLLQ